MTTADPFERLPRSIRTRLDGFSARVDFQSLDGLQLLAVVPPDGAREVARDRAADMAHRTNRTEAVTAIREIALDYVARRYSRPMQDPRQPFLAGGTATRTGAEERARLADSFEDALIGIALSDVLDEADVEELLGPWAGLTAG
jgi:hypothetical protein